MSTGRSPGEPAMPGVLTQVRGHAVIATSFGRRRLANRFVWSVHASRTVGQHGEDTNSLKH